MSNEEFIKEIERIFFMINVRTELMHTMQRMGILWNDPEDEDE